MKNVYLNHDGNIDDFISLLLLLQMPEINLIGVGVIDGDGYVDPAVSASRKIIDAFGKNSQISVARSNSRAVHQFPKEWRLTAFSFNDLPILNERQNLKSPLTSQPAHLDLVEKIMQSKNKVTLVMTGPLTDLARAIRVNPQITDNIAELYWMGGALHESGNVDEPNHNGSAEWNAYWDPEAVKTVWDSNINIVMVGLDSTKQVPLTQKLKWHWASLRRYPALDLIGQGYALVHSFETNFTYYLWDVLTTLSCNYPQIITTEETKSSVKLNEPEAGRTYCDPENGRPLTFVTSVNALKFFDKIDELGRKASYNWK